MASQKKEVDMTVHTHFNQNLNRCLYFLTDQGLIKKTMISLDGSATERKLSYICLVKVIKEMIQKVHGNYYH